MWWFWLLVGLVVGAIGGLFLFALCNMAARDVH